MYSNAATFPGPSHNQITNVMVQVYGDTATLYANVTRVLSNTRTETRAPARDVLPWAS